MDSCHTPTSQPSIPLTPSGLLFYGLGRVTVAVNYASYLKSPKKNGIPRFPSFFNVPLILVVGTCPNAVTTPISLERAKTTIYICIPVPETPYIKKTHMVDGFMNVVDAVNYTNELKT